MELKNALSNPWVKHTGKFAFSIGLVIYLISSVDLNRLDEPFRNANLMGVLVSTVLVTIGVIYLQALEIHYSMVKASRISVLALCKINFSLMFYVLFMPAGITFVIRWDKYRRAGHGGFDSAALVGFHKILQLVVAGAVAFLVLALSSKSLGQYGEELVMLIGIAMVLLVIGLVLVILGHGTKQTVWLLHALGLTHKSNATGWRLKLGTFVERVVTKLAAAFTTFRHLGTQNMLLVFLFACLQHLFIILSSWVIVAMVDPNATFMAVAFVRSVVVILLTIPISVGGLGVRELAFFTLFPLFGVSSASALTASLILFGVQLIVSAIGALVEIEAWFRPKTAI